MYVKKTNNELMKKIVYFLISGLCILPAMFGREYIYGGKVLPNNQNTSEASKILATCANTITPLELQINNVRARIFTKGDMWWDLGNTPKYIVPKNGINQASSLYAGMIWFGGKGSGGNLQVAAMTYRGANRVDFWSGPLIPRGLPGAGTITDTICKRYDQFFYIKKREVKLFYDYLETWTPASGPILYPIPQSIRDWPGNYPVNTINPLAPFFDRNNNLIYEPDSGDYPNYDIVGGADCLRQGNRFMYGDETAFWVFNDVGNGNTKSATGTPSIGMEIRSQAFAYQSNDQLNDMTFYSHELVNKGSTILDSTFFGVWTDADLGGGNDDFIGCDAANGFGYMYNADNNDANDGNGKGYLDQLPAVGIDFFRGPFKDSADVRDLNKDGDKTDINEVSWDMQFFTYFNNNATPYGDPTSGAEFYNYLTGRFRNGESLVYGGNGIPKIGGVLGGVNQKTRYCYPGDTDPFNRGTDSAVPLTSTNGPLLIPNGGWREDNNGGTPNAPDDRRFVQSAGPFRLEPGAINYITTGVPWAQATIKGDAKAALPLLRFADIKAQGLFDACFIKFEDIDPPSVTVVEVDKGFHAYLYNLPSSNNYGMGYSKTDPSIQLPSSAGDLKKYKFEGYIVYQLKEKAVSNSDLNDPSKAKPIFISNIKNGVKSITNYNLQYDPVKKIDVFVPELKVATAEEGIKSNFFVTDDLFATETSPKLVNEKTYYYAAIAYSYNEYKYFDPYNPVIGGTSTAINGQNIPFKGSSNATFFSIVPHINTNTVGATVVNYDPQNTYLSVTRNEGQGVGSFDNLKFDTQTEAEIVNSNFVKNPTYQPAAGPVLVKIIDPSKLTKSKFVLKLGVLKARNGFVLSLGDTLPSRPSTLNALVKDTLSWQLVNLSTGTTYTQKNAINYGEEFYIPEEGISVTFKQNKDYFGNSRGLNYINEKFDYYKTSITFTDPTKKWLTGIPDLNSSLTSPNNWILSGRLNSATGFFGTSNPNPLSPPNERDNSDIYSNVVSSGLVSAHVRKFVDSNNLIQKSSVVGWAPYSFTCYNIYGYTASGAIAALVKGGQPAMDAYAQKVRHRDVTNGRWKFLANVDLVITNDKSKWTRCPVIELGNLAANNQGNVVRHKLRSAPSVDKEGNVATGPDNNDNPNSMGWFPGYAINLSTGERLNIVFGEDSKVDATNGQDLVWNPSWEKSTSADPFNWGGKHYVYIFGHNGDSKFDNTYPSMLDKRADVDKYDKGKSIFDILSYTYPNAAKPDSAFAVYKEVWKDAMYVGLPLIDSLTYAQGKFVDLTDKKKITIPTETRISFRVNESMKYGYSGIYGDIAYKPVSNAPEIPTTKTEYTTNLSGIPVPATGSSEINGFNGNLPSYTFTTESLEIPTKTEVPAAKSALDLINLVPNPYYSGSEYETSRLDNVVKITNLPEKCTVKIYTMNGQLVREFAVDNTNNKTEFGNQTLTVNWDLKNFNSIPIASGLYLVYIKVPGVGEKVVKWFGTIRPTDLNSF
jgi:hypothetical protein